MLAESEDTTPSSIGHTAYFTLDGDRYHPSPIAQGGWGASMSGHVVGGLLGWAVERAVGDTEFLPARLTVDLPRPTALEPLEVQTRVVRNGKRLRLCEAVIRQDEKVVAQATGLFLRRTDQPPGQIWTPDVHMPAVPADSDKHDTKLFVRAYGWGLPIQYPDPTWSGDDGTKYAWLRLTQPLIEGEPLTAFTRAAMAADVTASLVNWGSDGLQFINADYTLTLSRLPDGPMIGLASHSHSTNDGVATGSAIIFDEQGECGCSVSVSLAQSGFRPPTA